MEGEKFELRSKLFDHVVHNGSNYLNGHCMVSILLSFPVISDGCICYLPLACYMPRWDIEVSYYENKAFWSLEEYRVRSREGIERLVNLECIAYSAMTLLPYSDETFSCYQSATRYVHRLRICVISRASSQLCPLRFRLFGS